MNKFLIVIVALFSSIGVTSMANDMKVVNVGQNQTLVRIHGNDKFLMLPVQENVEDSKVELLVNGKVEKTFYVRLAVTKTDYTVPFDLQPYKGENITLRVTAPQVNQHVRRSKRDTFKREIWLKELSLTDTFSTKNKEQYRPIYHHTPVYGWMNDPNGMFYKDGEWHLYYQWNPYGSRWQNMTWGHSSSSDFVNWTHHGAAIEPNDLGSIFSGSAAIDRTNSSGFGNDAIIALYTSAGDYQMQSLAWSNDNGETFTNYEDNPVITLPTEARDPNFFWNATTGLWNLVLAHALEKEVLIFSSPDLKNWTLENSFGKGLGAREGVWECPDLFEISIPGTDKKKWVMIVNINPGGPFGGSATQYFIGDFDGRTFVADTTPGGFVPTKWLDYGKDFYATVSWSDAPDARRPVIGWMSNWQYADEVPTMQFRSANSLPRDLGLFKGDDGQYYVSSLPSPEIISFRKKPSIDLKNITIGNNPKSFDLPKENGGICEILVSIETEKKTPVFLTLKNSIGDKVVMAYDPQSSTFSLDRTLSGVVDFSEEFPSITIAPTHEKKGKLAVRIFIDRSSIEVFESDGKFAMTNLVFPNEPYSTIEINAKAGTAKLNSLTVYPISLD